MKENRFIQAIILIVSHSSYFSRTSSNTFFSSTAIAKISFTGFSSACDSTVETVVMSSGQSSCLYSHSGPFSHNCIDSSTLPPLLPKSAGFSLVFTYLHWTYAFSRIFFTRFRMNCLYSPPHFNQCKAVVLSSQP